MADPRRILTSEQRQIVHRMRAEVLGLLAVIRPALTPLDEFEMATLHTDEELVRFLRSRVWAFEVARDGVVEWLRWRRSFKPTEVTIEDCDPDMAKSGVFFFHGYDKLGQPLCYVNARLLRPGHGDVAAKERFCILQMERAKRMIKMDGSRCAAYRLP